MRRRAHTTVQVVWKKRRASIDKRLAPLILALWKLGVKTLNCCQGYSSGERAYIMFDSWHAEYFLKVAQRALTDFTWEGEFSWSQRMQKTTQCHTTVRFPPKDIKAICKELQAALKKAPEAQY